MLILTLFGGLSLFPVSHLHLPACLCAWFPSSSAAPGSNWKAASVFGGQGEVEEARASDQ